MAVEISDGTGTPHATDYEDLLDKLVTFATANGWTELENTSDKIVLEGEGLGATDEIIVAFQKYSDVGADAFGWRLQGYSGYQNGFLFNDQPGHIPSNEVSLPLWNDEIPYWFIVSERRIIVVAKVSTTFQMAYLGFFLPFASPNQYPYPLAVGGSYVESNGVTSKPRFSGTGSQSSAFWAGLSTGFGKNTWFTRLAGGAWLSQGNTASIVGQNSQGMYPYNQPDVSLMRQAVDDEPVLMPIEIHQNITTPVQDIARLGEIDGVYHVSGFSQSAEDIITIGSDDYLVVPNVFRAGNADYAAIKLV